MKKLFLSLVVVLFGIVLVSCGGGKTEKSTVQLAIEDAQKLSYEELLAKAVEEIGGNSLQVYGNSSALEKALVAFSASTGIKTTNNQLGDSDLYQKLTNTIPSGTYSADMILAQDGNSLQTMLLNEKYVQNYVPKEYKDVISADDFVPATATIYLNKIFMYNNKDGKTNLLTNVWQMAGKTTDVGHVSNISFKSASTENVNMNFLIMLTKPEWVEKLTAAYKAFYGKDYVAESGYANIGYKWIKEFIVNSNTHTSDGTSVENMPKGVSGNGVLANYNKIKAVSAADKELITVAAYDGHLAGFDGFVYKMYSLVASNAKYPYAACALINYMSSAEGYQKAWGGLVGYYSANPTVSIASGDQSLAFWKANCVIEDPVWVAQAYANVYPFVTSAESSKK